MKIFKIIKEFLFPKMYSGIEIAEMGKNIKFDYYPEAVDLIYSSNKLTDSEKHRMVENLIYGYTQNKFIDKNAYEYLKRKLK
jgi:hypothetical protein